MLAINFIYSILGTIVTIFYQLFTCNSQSIATLQSPSCLLLHLLEKQRTETTFMSLKMSQKRSQLLGDVRILKINDTSDVSPLCLVEIAFKPPHRPFCCLSLIFKTGTLKGRWYHHKVIQKHPFPEKVLLCIQSLIYIILKIHKQNFKCQMEEACAFFFDRILSQCNLAISKLRLKLEI